MGILNGITYTELVGSGNLSFVAGALGDDCEGERLFYVDWADADSFAAALRGYSKTVEGVWVRTSPQAWPGRTNLVCARVTIEGVAGKDMPTPDPLTGMIRYTKARIVARYAPLTATYSTTGTGDRYVEDERDFSTEQYTVSDWKEFTLNGVAVGQPLAVSVGHVLHNVTIHNSPTDKASAITAALGCVNSSSFYGSPAETVLLASASTRKRVDVHGDIVYAVTMMFDERSLNWNKGLYVSGASLAAGYFTPKPYSTASFSGLLT